MTPQESIDPEFEALLDYLRISRGFDFTGYKRSSLMRRVNKRRYTLSLSSYAEYLDYLQVHPDEFGYLFDTILINVTSFFRDKAAWEHLSDDIIPRIMAKKSNKEPIRIWSAGCASGEEAYSLAILFAEHLGSEAFHECVKIYATDMDREALSQARQAVYSRDDLRSIPEELSSKYFIHTTNNNYQFSSELRRAVIFGEHDLVQDAPISRLDLLVCRNTLMYFNSETQSRILSRFHFALNDGGILFLGKAEMLLTHGNLFTALDMRYRFFTKVIRPDIRDQFLSMGQIADDQISNRLGRVIRMRDLTFDSSPEAQLIVDSNGVLIAANDRARKLFNISSRDIGGLIHDMEVCYQPVGLRPLIDRVVADKQSAMIPEVEMRIGDGNICFLDVYVTPLKDDGNNLIGVSIIYTDISRTKSLEEKLKQSSAELETTNEELQSTNEELETTNEELQSTVEELETTNEELQSTNEELETMNEELQSTNEELETINDELGQRTTELNESKSFLESILGNLKTGIVVVNRDFGILNWNTKSEDLWGMRADEILGQSLLGLDIGLPVEKLKHPIRQVLDGKADGHEIDMQALTRRGKTIDIRVFCSPFMSANNEPQGAILVFEEKEDSKPS